MLLEVLRDRADDVLRFAHDLRIPPTNNQAERDLRPAEARQKISGRLRFEQHTRLGTPSTNTCPPRSTRPRRHYRPARRACRQALNTA
ncbi:transposase [Nonomuraea sp. NPDC000554]|uniref:IS66 family transposase n=1 Tax=Nonomuraea sp. NPDC000554 TaxID=3154259 RepID=UPI00333052BC